MTDIVERLRQGVDTSEPPDKTDRVMWEAAAEIERLREELRVVLMHVAELARAAQRQGPVERQAVE